ncbi:pectin lyase-like protein [Sarocladium strictum]
MASFGLVKLGLVLLALPLDVIANKHEHHLDPALVRPTIHVAPHNTGKQFPVSPQRNPKKVCRVKGKGDGKDASKAILKAMRKCNDGGIVALEGQLTVGKALDLTFLKHIDVAILGSIKFTDDVDYWVANSFKYDFQNSSTFWRWGGKDVNIFSHGVGEIDGNGQAWYNLLPTNSTLLRPILFVADGLHDAQISGLKMINSPNWFNLYYKSSNIIVSDMNLHAFSNNSKIPPKNTDGWDTLSSSNIVIQDSVINNTDDCVSFKPNSTSIVIQNLNCNGSHGISVGSLGRYVGEVDIVEDVYVYNTSMSNASDGARLKINQCYGQNNLTACQQNPSKLVLEDVLFKDFTGTASAKYDPQVGRLVCSSPDVCINIRGENLNINAPSGKIAYWTCAGVDTSKLGVNCKPPA